jgi:hypothetical protein
MGPDFEAMAKVALGTDDPERLAAFKEAVMACMGAEEAGEYEDEEMGESMASGSGSPMAALFGGKK